MIKINSSKRRIGHEMEESFSDILKVISFTFYFWLKTAVLISWLRLDKWNSTADSVGPSKSDVVNLWDMF